MEAHVLPRRELLAILALALVPLTAATTPAGAATGCTKFSDGANDASSASLDIRSGSVVTDKKKKVLIGKLAVTNTDPSPETAAALGTSWFLNFVGRGKNYSFERRESSGVSKPGSGGPMMRTVTNALTGGATTVVPKVTVTKTTFTFTVPLKAVPGVAGGSLICNINATTKRLGQSGDAATPTQP
jgi:hypothetical protein